jgi:hypothetical protein
MLKKTFISLFSFLILSVVGVVTLVELGGVHYFVSPFLKGIFKEYVPELEYSRLKYSLFSHEKITLTEVKYKVSADYIKASEVELHILNLEELLKSINTKSSDVFRDLKFNVEGQLEELELFGVKLNTFNLNVYKGKGQKLHFKNLKTKKVAKDTNLTMFVDIAKERFEFNARSVNISDVLKLLNNDFSATGLINGRGYISWKGDLSGYLHIESHNFYFKGIQLDKILDTFAKPGKTDAVDVAAIVALGPVGLLASSTTQMGSGLIIYRGGESYLNELNVTLSMNNNHLHFNDVAFSTRKNRASIKGRVNLDNLKFVETTFYILDDNSCALLSQDIIGTLVKPDLLATVAFINSLVSPFVSIVKKVPLFSCEKVYGGNVEHPKEKK